MKQNERFQEAESRDNASMDSAEAAYNSHDKKKSTDYCQPVHHKLIPYIPEIWRIC